MLRVMVVDDEKIIREGIAYLTDWAKLDCVLASFASDGEEAIAYLESHQGSIDVVLSDIKMPRSDGLAVARYVSEHCPLTQTIILTAYTDFSYAQQAIRYGVTDFILKNDIAERMPPAIEKVKTVLSERREQQTEKETKAALIRRNQATLYESVMRNAVLGLYRPALGEEPDARHVVAVAEAIPLGLQGAESQLKTVLSLSFRNLDAVVCTVTSGVFSVLVFLDASCPMQQKLSSLFAQVRDALPSYKLLVAYSEESSHIDSLYDTTLQALERLRSIPCSAEEGGSVSLESLLQSANQLDEMQYCHLVQRKCNESVPFETLRLDCLRLFSSLSSAFSPYLEEEDNRLLSEVQKAQSRYRLSSLLLLYGRACIHSHDPYANVHNPLVRSIIVYIRQNYHKPVNLQSIADTFMVSDSYLSRLYHKETGVSLIQTLNTIRIEAAKAMLSDPTIRIGDIAEKVGIPDSTYFAHLFQKMTGSSPSSWRKLSKN